jgi:hypothetical protein
VPLPESGGESMYDNHRFIITVDTEADDAWKVKNRIGLRNLSAIPRFQALCEEYEIVPTYLLAYECAVRDEALSVFKPIVESKRCEIGFHLHCWTTPPFEREFPDGIDAAWMHAYQYELPATLFLEKCESLYEAIVNAYGVRPRAHRAGRWGIDQRSVDWLIEKNFLIDTSVVPTWDLSDKLGKRMGGPSFIAANQPPYYWLHSNAGTNLSQSLLEVPVTIYTPTVFPLVAMARYMRRGRAGRQLAERIYHRLIGGNGTLRPHPQHSLHMLLKIIRSQLSMRPTIINMMIHSSELMVGESPFSRTQQDTDMLWEKLRWSFAFIQDLQIKSVGISSTADVLEKGKINYESPDFASRLQRPGRRGSLLQEAQRQILDTGPAPDYRKPAG